MYERHFGFQEKPFALLPDPAFLYLSEKHRMGLTMLEYGLENLAGFTVVTGEIGSGKTTLLRKLLQTDDPEVSVGLVTNTQCANAAELLRWIAFSFDLDYEGRSQVALYHALTDFVITEYSVGRRVVLIVDEAQQLGIELLEQVRMMSNINADKHQVIQFILVGQPSLRELLRRPELRQFAQRIVVDYHLEALSLAETEDYVRHRVKVAGGGENLFSPEACRLVGVSSRGVPRLINVLCDAALVYAFSEGKADVDADIVEEVLRDKEKSLAPVQHDRAPPLTHSVKAADHSNMIEKLFGN